MVVYALVKLKV